MYFSNFNSNYLKQLLGILIFTSLSSIAFAGIIEATLCQEDGSTNKISFSEGVTFVGATTDAAYGNMVGNFLTGYVGGVWGSVAEGDGPIDGLGAAVNMSVLTTTTRPLVINDYGFNIPCNATITDVNINITRRNTQGEDVIDGEVRLRLPNYSLSATNLAGGTAWLESTTAWETVSYNDATWGETLTAEMLNDSRFGAWIIATTPGSTESARPEVDAVEIEVCYTVAGTAFQQIEVAVSKGNGTCGIDNGQINISAQNGSGTFEYSIDNGVTWDTNPSFSGLAPGSYLITVRNTDGSCQTGVFNCLVGANETILQPGDAIGTCDPSGDPVTLYIERVQPLFTYYSTGYQGADISDLIEPSVTTWTAGELGGEVFSVTYDDAYNIYTGTTSLYSPTNTVSAIVSKIDGVTGVASALTTLPGTKGIAGVEWDSTCGQLFVSNLEDGIIYRLDATTGATLSTFDPLGADSGTVGFEALGEIILGLAVSPSEGRLYYSVWANDEISNGARNTIRSIAIDPITCDFLPGTDVEEIQLPFLSEACGAATDVYSMPVSDIEISASGGTIILAESGINSTNLVKTPHKARILEYDGSTGAWVIDNAPDQNNTNGCKYGIGTYREQNNARGGVDFANAGFDASGCLTGEEDFITATVDGVFGVNCTESCVYGIQYLSSNGGGPFQSVGVDLDRDNNSQLKSIYGDIDMVSGCLTSDPQLCLEYDLAVSATLQTTGTIEPGDIITIQYVIDNEGTMAAANVGITGTLPAGYTYVSSTPVANVTDNGDNTFDIASLGIGGTQIIDVMYMVPANATAGSVDFFIEITTDDGDDIDSNPATSYDVDEDGDLDPFDDDEDVVEVLVTIINYDLAIDIALNGGGPFSPGDNVTYTVTVTNEGDQPAAGIIATNNSDTGLIFQSMTPTGNVTDNADETFTIASIPVGGMQTFEVVYQIDPTFTGTSLDIISLITTDDGDDTDSNPAMDETVDEDGDLDPYDDDEDLVTTPILLLDYDLSLNKTLGGTAPYIPGTNVTFTIVVSNDGDITANNVIVTENAPASLIYQSMTPIGNVTDNGDETFTITSLASGATQAFDVVYQIDANFTGTSINNIALITSDDGDDIDSDPTMDETQDEDGDGNPFDDDEDEVTVPIIIPPYDLSLTKTLNGTAPYVPGTNVTFTITVSNDGDLDANNTIVTEKAATGLIFQSMTPVANVTDNGDETFTITALASMTTQSFDVVYQIDPAFTGSSISNIALITSDDGDDNDSDPTMDETQDEDGDGNPFDDDEDEVSVPITIPPYDLSLTKVLNGTAPYNPGTIVTFTITVSNDGDIDANNTIVTEKAAAGLIYQSMTPVANVTDNGDETFTITALASMTTQSFDVMYQIDPTFTGSSISNIALITSDDGDDNDSDPTMDETQDEDGDGNPFDDDEDEVTVPVIVPPYDLSLTKALNGTGPYIPGANVTFTITVSNDGAVDANNIVVTESTSAALIFQGMTPTANVTDNGDETFTLAAIASGTTQSFEVVYQIDPDFTGATLSNLALISEDDGDDIDSDPGMDETEDEDGDGDPFDDDEDEVDVPVTIPPYDLSLTKVLNGVGPFSPGQEVIFTIIVLNEGDVDAANIVVTENATTGLIYQGMTPNALVTDNGNETFTISSIASGSLAMIEVTYLVDPTFTGTSLRNVALITSDDGNDMDSDPAMDETVDEDGDGDPVDDDEDIIDIDITPIGLATIGDYVWEDSNGNGSQDSNESGIEGIEVVLHTPEGVIVSIQYTDASGFYEFTDIMTGDYYLEFNVPIEWDVTFPNTNNNNTTDSDVDHSNGFNTTPLFNLSNGEEDLSWDAGFYKCVPLGDLVWFDINENDIWDSVENGVNGMKVNVYKQGFDGQYFLWDYTFTGPNVDTPSDDGYFKFCVPPGTYYLEFVSPPVGLVNAQANAGSNDEIDSDVTGTFGSGTTNSMTFNSGESECSIGSGYYPMGSIGDFVFIDNNQNGVRDPNESGLGNVYIEAYDLDGNIVGSANSSSNGQYEIDYLPQENIYLKFYTNSNFASTMPNVGDASTDSDIDHSNGPMTTKWINIKAGEHQPNIDAGFVFGTVAVDWISFAGRQINNYNALQWNIGTEINTSHYLVERSIGSVSNFETITKVFATQASLSNAMYVYDDFDIEESAEYFYRIKMVDNNGGYNYSDVIIIDVENTNRLDAHVAVFPNPMVDEFTIELSLTTDQTNLSYQLYSTDGKLIRDVKSLATDLSSGKHLFIIDVKELPEGVYNLSVQTENSSFTKKLIVLK